MSYKIVVDSCCELPESLKKDPRFQIVPLGLQVDDWHIIDDETFDQAEFLRRVADSKEINSGKSYLSGKYFSVLAAHSLQSAETVS